MIDNSTWLHRVKLGPQKSSSFQTTLNALQNSFRFQQLLRLTKSVKYSLTFKLMWHLFWDIPMISRREINVNKKYSDEIKNHLELFTQTDIRRNVIARHILNIKFWEGIWEISSSSLKDDTIFIESLILLLSEMLIGNLLLEYLCWNFNTQHGTNLFLFLCR